MSKKKHTVNRLIGFIPAIGIVIFVLLYIYSTFLYPGGSQAKLDSIGFDWKHNYWCNLLNEKGMNGQDNPARGYAITAMTILCISLLLFFIQFAQTITTSRFWKLSIQLFGTISMVFAIFIFTSYHDLMTILSSIFGAFAVFGVIRDVYISKMNRFKISGIFCLILLAVNNYIYYTEQGIIYLPLLQKITFLAVLIWMIAINYKLNKLIKQGEKQLLKH